MDPKDTPQPAAAAAQLPEHIGRIWARFSEREIGRGRRDIGALIEVTLQFILEQENRSLMPMVTAMEGLRQWEVALNQEALALHKKVAEGSGDLLAAPYQKVNITLNREANATTPLRRVPHEAPTRSRPELLAFLEQMQRQQALVTQAAAEHMQALQGRRQDQAERLRSYAGTMHALALETVARMPEPVVKAAKSPRAAGADAPGLQPAPPTRRLRLPTRQSLAAIDWQRLNPIRFARACLAALVQGYREEPPDEDA